jgi:hypothetical protein
VIDVSIRAPILSVGYQGAAKSRRDPILGSGGRDLAANRPVTMVMSTARTHRPSRTARSSFAYLLRRDAEFGPAIPLEIAHREVQMRASKSKRHRTPQSAWRQCLGGNSDTSAKPEMQVPHQDMNFKVSPGWHRGFKGLASMLGISMKALMEACVRAWLDKYGDDHHRALFRPPR